jgi:selenide,water dikinase
MDLAPGLPALTSLSHGAGCGCKIPAADLRPIVGGLPRSTDPRVLVGSDTSDDAGVVRLRDDLAIVQTADFFTPIVDDPYAFGRIAATNALSDIYAMGGEPVSALNLVAFPLATLGAEVLSEILRGGGDACQAAGAAVVGGHSIDDPEPKYGLAVTGTVHPDEVLTNRGGRDGDVLVLTKPLGAGTVATALKRGLADDALVERAVEVMTTLNDVAARQSRAAGAHALTDVTGFGLLGHVHELAEASGLAAVVDAEAIPAIDGVLDLLADGDRALAGGSKRNRADAEDFCEWADGVSEPRRRLACDAMTSGGLLAAVPAAAAGSIDGWVVGRLEAGVAGTIGSPDPLRTGATRAAAPARARDRAGSPAPHPPLPPPRSRSASRSEGRAGRRRTRRARTGRALTRRGRDGARAGWDRPGAEEPERPRVASHRQGRRVDTSSAAAPARVASP